jgi:site-specific DNA-methyltransferase (adenine-specific)
MDQVLLGDCLEELKKIEDHSVDLICTDPPYGYSFMGKNWDKAVPSVEIWKEALRVLKPGAFAFVMSAPRQDVLSQMIMRLGQAGFDTSFTSIYWTYASGFPKAMNIGKMVDKRVGAERKVIGTRTQHDIRNNNYGTNKTDFIEEIKGSAVSDEAKALDGSYGGFQPKPAVEVIIVCMKPLSEKTYVDQALKNGKGMTWLDDCKVPSGPRINPSAHNKDRAAWRMNTSETEGRETDGRFPANLLVSDDVLNDGYNHKSSGHYHKKSTNNWLKKKSTVVTQNDSGSYSRYFSLDAWADTLPFLIVPKASRGEKNEGLEEMPEKVKPLMGDFGTNPGRVTPKSSNTPRANFHPTVKPLKLMSYLIALGSRPNGTVLDPFLGSGTTALAAKQLGRHYVGIEREAEYVGIATARLAHTEPKPKTLFAA